MTAKSKVVEEQDNIQEKGSFDDKKTCFVIMPIADQQGYDTNHFFRVYDEIIKPAVIRAGFIPKRADDVKQTHIIILEILKSVTSSDMAICDLSALNPNVLYELGIRQMSQKPVVLIKDIRTRRIFDTGILSDIEYDESLRVDTVRTAIDKIHQSIVNTFNNFDGTTNSLVDLLSLNLVITEEKVPVTPEMKVMMDKIDRLTTLISANQPSRQDIDNSNIQTPIHLSMLINGDFFLMDQVINSRIERTLHYVAKADNGVISVVVGFSGMVMTYAISDFKNQDVVKVSANFALAMYPQQYNKIKNTIGRLTPID